MYSGGNTVSALSHSNDDDRISPAERTSRYLLEDAGKLFTKLDADLATVKAYDSKNTSSEYQLAYSNKQTNERTNEQTNERTNERTNE